MLKIETVRIIKQLLLSDKLTYTGQQVPLLVAIMTELDAEEAAIVAAANPVDAMPADALSGKKNGKLAKAIKEELRK